MGDARKLSTTLCALAFALGVLGFADTALAEAWTGCVTPGGTIVRMKQGEVPLRPCSKNELVIHLTDKASKQNSNASYNHETNCKALESSGATPSLLVELGCPLGTEPKPQGEPIPITRADTGPLSVVPCENDASTFCTRVENAFIGRQFYVSNEGFENNLSPTSACPAACESDDRCFLSFLENAATAVKDYPQLVCHLYYRSDNVGATENWCNVSERQCRALTVQVINPHWYRVEQ